MVSLDDLNYFKRQCNGAVVSAVLNATLDQVNYRTQSEYNEKECIHFIELSSIACNKIPCLFYTIDLEREQDREKDTGVQTHQG